MYVFYNSQKEVLKEKIMFFNLNLIRRDIANASEESRPQMPTPFDHEYDQLEENEK